MIKNRKGYLIADFNRTELKQRTYMNRVVACVNSLQGIPDSWLEGRAAAKALLAWKLIEEQNELHSREFAGLNNDGIIKAAVMFRKRGADFGELNALIDSFKEEA